VCVYVCVLEARLHACDAEHREVGQDFEVSEEAERKEDGSGDESEEVVARSQPSYTHTHTHTHTHLLRTERATCCATTLILFFGAFFFLTGSPLM
jgi:hypothetical protein